MLHRTLTGDWAFCADRDSCKLPFHLDDLTVEQAQATPLELLLPLFNMIEPAYLQSGELQIWMKVERGALYHHRDYDLPAVVHTDGTLQWWKNGKLHRENGPAIIVPGGSRSWYQHGEFLTFDPRQAGREQK